MDCDKLAELYEQAVQATDNAETAYQSAIENKDAAAYALGGAMLSTVACLAAIPVGASLGSLPGAVIALILCEAIAAMLIESALQWLESAVKALELAEKALKAAQEAEDSAGDAYEECLNSKPGQPLHEKGIDPKVIEFINDLFEEADTAIDESQADGEEVEGLIDDLEDAVDDVEDAVEEDLEEQKNAADTGDSGFIY